MDKSLLVTAVVWFRCYYLLSICGELLTIMCDDCGLCFLDKNYVSPP